MYENIFVVKLLCVIRFLSSKHNLSSLIRKSIRSISKNKLFFVFQNTEFSDTWSCMQHNSLNILDDIIVTNTIPLTDKIQLIRRQNRYFLY